MKAVVSDTVAVLPRDVVIVYVLYPPVCFLLFVFGGWVVFVGVTRNRPDSFIYYIDTTTTLNIFLIWSAVLKPNVPRHGSRPHHEHLHVVDGETSQLPDGRLATADRPFSGVTHDKRLRTPKVSIGEPSRSDERVVH
jgi:hypothetical protein